MEKGERSRGGSRGGRSNADSIGERPYTTEGRRGRQQEL
jgi:hypothetical protein